MLRWPILLIPLHMLNVHEVAKYDKRVIKDKNVHNYPPAEVQWGGNGKNGRQYFNNLQNREITQNHNPFEAQK